MDKYSNMKSLPRFSGEWEFFAFSFLNLLTLGNCFFQVKMVNNLAYLPLFFTLLNYGLWIAIVLVIVWRLYDNPA